MEVYRRTLSDRVGTAKSLRGYAIRCFGVAWRCSRSSLSKRASSAFAHPSPSILRPQRLDGRHGRGPTQKGELGTERNGSRDRYTNGVLLAQPYPPNSPLQKGDLNAILRLERPAQRAGVHHGDASTNRSTSLLLADYETPAARPQLAAAWRQRIGRCDNLRLQSALREVTGIQRHDEVGVCRFGAFAERRIVPIRQI
jgi:hypothetical protein